MIRKKKKYSRPRKAYDLKRIKEEDELVAKYGLKNKREIWKAEAAISRIRKRAKKLITAKTEEQEKLFNKLNSMGFKVAKIADILDLKKENWLKRRLQSIIVEKNLAKPKEARQLIAHKHVSISGRIMNIPGYIVKVDEEEKIHVDKGKTIEMKKMEAEIKNEQQ
ncbi:30S ribosomal protein S4 [Candidatus Pacearchaeota archaeon]|nr:30S ribosomal protein S4 [Candidatus Pacearchaeota archaeon]